MHHHCHNHHHHLNQQARTASAPDALSESEVCWLQRWQLRVSRQRLDNFRRLGMENNRTGVWFCSTDCVKVSIVGGVHLDKTNRRVRIQIQSATEPWDVAVSQPSVR